MFCHFMSTVGRFVKTRLCFGAGGFDPRVFLKFYYDTKSLAIKGLRLSGEVRGGESSKKVLTDCECEHKIKPIVCECVLK